MLTVAEELAKTFKKFGVRYVFGIPGGASLLYMQAFKKYGIEFILVKNEASAGIIATVIGRLTRNLAVCHATFGPGATNLTTGVGCAYLDRVPLIVVTNEMSDDKLNRTVQMNVSHQSLFKPITKWTTRLSPTSIEKTIKKVFNIACSEVPGPVHLGLPSNIAEISIADSLHKYIKHPTRLRNPQEQDIQNMKKKFQAAKKPLLVVGLSAVRMKLSEKIQVLMEKHHLPCVLTPMAKGIVSQDVPNYVGVLFHALSHMLNSIISQTDLVVGVGYDPVEYNYESWMPNAPLLHLDTVPADVDKTINVVGNVVGDLGYSIAQLTKLEPNNNLWDFQEIVQNKQKLLTSLRPKTTGFSPSQALDVLREEMDQESILTCDVGAHLHLIGQLWRTPSSESLIMTNGWSSMGFGIPAAIGAKLVFPQKQVACVSGDGGFLMMLGELITARRLRLNIPFIILKDNQLSLINVKQKRRNMDNYGITLYEGELFQSKTILGVPIYTAVNEDDMRKSLRKAFSGDTPVVIETRIDGSVYEKLIARG